MKNKILLLSLLLFFSCTQLSREKEEPVKLPPPLQYVNNPSATDELCKTEIKRAKKDIETRGGVLTESVGFHRSPPRYESELKTYCELHGLIYEYELLSDMEVEEQTQGCYGYYMDKIIIDQFGWNFEKELRNKADSVWLGKILEKNVIIEYWDCDERPRLPTEEKQITDHVFAIRIQNPAVIKNESKFGGWPFIDLGFIIEIDSTINNFHIRGFEPHLEENRIFEDELFLVAREYIERNHPLWVPGKIRESYVCTDFNVRVRFKNE